jgi:succinoglycan biosynthesis transport protein ExoP
MDVPESQQNLERLQQATHSGVNLQELGRILRIHKYKIGTFAILSMALTSIYGFFETPKYKASVVISTVPTDSFRSVSEITSSKYLLAAEAADTKMNTLNEYFKSPQIGHRLLEVLQEKNDVNPIVRPRGFKSILSQLGLQRPLTITEAVKVMPKEQIEAELTSYLRTSTNYTNSTLSVEATTPDPYFSAFLANEAGKALLEINRDMGVSSVKEMKKFLTNQETELGAKLTEMEDKIASFQSKHQILSENSAESFAFQNLDSSERSFQEVSEHLDTNMRLIDNTNTELKNLKENIADPKYSGSGLYTTQLLNRLKLLQYQQAMAGNITDKERFQSEIDAVAVSYKKALGGSGPIERVGNLDPLQYYNELQNTASQLVRDNKNLNIQLGILGKSLRKKKAQFSGLVVTSQKLSQLQRDLSLTNDLYMVVKKKIQDTEVYETATVNDISILAEAAPPATPHSAPQLIKLLFALFFGLFFGFSTVFLSESLIPTVRNRQDLEKFEFTILGEVPSIAYSAESVIVLRDIPNSYEADVYRSIRMKLIASPQLTKDENSEKAKAILMTSARGGNGKTFTAVNLATTLANGQYKVLLIDLDLRNPSVHTYYPNLKIKYFIDDILIHDGLLEKNKNIVTEISPNLHIIFGKGAVSNPAESLDSQRIKSMIESKMKDYDFVIFDMPPVLGLIDSLLIAPVADAIIFVAEHRKTYIDDLALAKKLLDEVTDLKMFAIINFVHREFTYYDNLRYYQYRGRMRNKTDGPRSIPKSDSAA